MVIPAIPTHVHVIGIRVKGCGEQSLLDTECLADQNGGLYIGVESEDDLAKALEKTLGCPMLSDRTTATKPVRVSLYKKRLATEAKITSVKLSWLLRTIAKLGRPSSWGSLLS